MRKQSKWASLAVAAWAMVIGGLSLSVCVAEKVPAEPSAKELFQQAIAQDAAGNSKQSRQLLSQALRVDPDFELARWYSGQVMFRGNWLSIDAVGLRVSGDPRWEEYRERLAATGTTRQARAELARWCRQEGLQNEEQLHWRQVLQLDPNNAEALAGLGVRRYQGGLYTPAEIEDKEEQAALQQRKTKHYQREFKRWANQGRRGSETLRHKMISQFEAVDDPLAVEALREALVDACHDHSAKERPFNDRLCSAILSALGNIPQHSATMSLLDAAVYAPEPELRRKAAKQLRTRDKTSFMPLLMANLAAPLETSFQINVTPAGHVSVVQDFEEESPLAIHREVESQDMSSHTLVPWTGRDPATGKTVNYSELWMNPAADYRRATQRVSTKLQQVEQINQQRVARNARIVEVLQYVTDENHGGSPQAWWSAWRDYNELQYDDEKPIYEDYYRSEYEPATYYYRTTSCFVAGTPVWTQSGPVAIENIQAGDLVLSQDPATGRLDYRPVLETTIRPPSELKQLVLPDETILTTLGHRFWVAGQGWQMAKFLTVGTPLFSTSGLRELRGIESAEQAPAYNLVVGDFHTYFVGKSRLLVHDNNCPQPIAVALPGVPLERGHLDTRVAEH